MASPNEPHHHAVASVPDTIISLIVAFVIAMAFRGFVLEGFVIPTGSMAPTLLGEHSLWRSDATGYVFRTDASDRFVRASGPDQPLDLFDPMLGRDVAVDHPTRLDLLRHARAGDRVLVFKWLYTLFDPNRYDVIVFRNPTSPRENYIKRLIGLPNEEVWLAEGDVFTRDQRDPGAPFEVRRKPEHVQRAVWQPVHDMTYFEPGALDGAASPPWEGDGWTADGRAFRTSGAIGNELRWDLRRRSIDDWNPYNMFGGKAMRMPDNPAGLNVFNVSDLRVRAGVTIDGEGDVRGVFTLRAHAHEFQWVIEGGSAFVRMRRAAVDGDPPPTGGTSAWRSSPVASIDPFEVGAVRNVEFWHVDQSLMLFIDGERVAHLEYEWTPRERLAFATGRDVDDTLANSNAPHPWVQQLRPSAPSVSWSIDGAPATVHRLALDRDLYYQPAVLDDDPRQPAPGTHPEHTALLGPDHFFMCGDNSSASFDSRLWSGSRGYVDRLVAAQIDATPFVVNRRLIVGRAWAVYFPAPYSVTEGGRRFVPDFGRLRFIR